MLVDRGRERAAIDWTLAEGSSGNSAAVAFDGPPGIGKTALLEYAAQRTEAATVLRASGVESEAQIPFASLLEVLRPVLSLLGRLTGPQAAALERAFALRPGLAQDRFAVGAATLGLLAAAAEEQPLVVLLDDVQWFDGPSAEALRFALRRLEADPVAAILAVREGHGSLLDGAGIHTLALGGLSAAEARALRPDLSAAAAEWLVEVTGGNPLAVLELTPDPDELVLTPNGAPVLLSARISAAYLQRVATLDPAARRCLLLAATSDSGDVALLTRAGHLIDVDIDAVLDAEALGLVTITAGRVEFQHPLIRSAVYSDATFGERRAAHRALASVLPDHEVDRRAWHLAAAAAGLDESASLALAEAARHNLQRGGYATAAAALERAGRLTAVRTRRTALLIRAAQAAWDAGRGEQARRLLGEVRTTGAVAGDAVFAAERLAGHIAISHGPVMEGHAILTEAALLAAAEPGGDGEAIALLADATVACFLACAAPELAATHAEAQRMLTPDATPGTRMLAEAIRGVALILGADAAAGTGALRAAAAIVDDHPELFEQQPLLPWIALGQLFLRESGVGRVHFERALRAARQNGGIGTLPFVLGLIGRDQATSERWPVAEATYREAMALARESDQPTWLAYALAGLAWVLARQGRAVECGANASEALRLGELLGAQLPALWALSALGELELALGHPAEAITQFERQRDLAHAHAISDVDLWPAAEMVEAHVRLDHRDRACTLTAAFHVAADAKGQPWSVARALRCEGLIAEPEKFAEQFEAALRHHEQTPDVFELARTRLAYGERLRRNRNRVLARSQLRRAEEIFDQLEARPWLARTRAELEATGERLRPHGEPQTIAELTPQELQIAAMLASGRTTRETAAALFLSPKTIEYHLRHMYLKLDIHSRDELAAVLRASPPSGARLGGDAGP